MKSRCITWISGFFGAISLVHLVKALLGLDFVIPQLGFTLDTTMSLIVFIVAGMISWILWTHSNKTEGKAKKKSK